jgi:flavin-binding protein dodecin
MIQKLNWFQVEENEWVTKTGFVIYKVRASDVRGSTDIFGEKAQWLFIAHKNTEVIGTYQETLEQAQETAQEIASRMQS